MALVLSLKQGETITIGEQEFTVDKISESGSFCLRSGDDVTQITEDRSMELVPEVMVSAGYPDRRRHARVVIEAPRSIEIRRAGR